MILCCNSYINKIYENYSKDKEELKKMIFNLKTYTEDIDNKKEEKKEDKNKDNNKEDKKENIIEKKKKKKKKKNKIKQ